MRREYVHEDLGKDVNVPSGYYALHEELRLKQDGREVLCIVGVGVVECSCCAGDCIVGGRGGPYAIVPGYLLAWKCRTNDAGLPVSEVEPVADDATRREVARAIRETQQISNIEFW